MDNIGGSNIFKRLATMLNIVMTASIAFMLAVLLYVISWPPENLSPRSYVLLAVLLNVVLNVVAGVVAILLAWRHKRQAREISRGR